jgi:hypothetical protein
MPPKAAGRSTPREESFTAGAPAVSARFSQVLDRVRQLQPTRIFSHLPAAGGTSLEAFLKVLETVPDAEPFMLPDSPPVRSDDRGHGGDATRQHTVTASRDRTGPEP